MADRGQPIDIRMPLGELPSFREMLVAFGTQLGELRAGQDHAKDDRVRVAEKIDILNEKFDVLALRVEQHSGAGNLQDKVIGDLVKIIGDDERGLIHDVEELQQLRQRGRGMMIGIGIGSGVAGATSWAGLSALLRKWGVF